MIEDLVQELIDRLDHRYFGKHRGYVHQVDDPDRRGRIRAIVPQLLGDSTPTGWAEPALPFAGPDQGFFTVPDLGAGVWIEFEHGDLSKPIWSGCWWGAPTEAERQGATSATRRATPPTAEAEESGERVPETPQHQQPRESPEPKVRIFKAANDKYIVLDDRPDSERIEIHDSQGNRLILDADGFTRIMSNERTRNRGNRGTRVMGRDDLYVAGEQNESIGRAHNRSVGGDVSVAARGKLSESYANGAYTRTFGASGLAENIDVGRTVGIAGDDELSVTGAGSHSYTGGLGVSSAGGISFTSAGPYEVGAAVSAPAMNVVSIGGGIGNVSINTMLGVMQLGGPTAISPAVLGDGLMIHLTMLAQVLKAINPPLVPIYGPLVDTWAAMTPALDLSYYAFIKRFPVG